jgi:hypothetical protein
VTNNFNLLINIRFFIFILSLIILLIFYKLDYLNIFFLISYQYLLFKLNEFSIFLNQKIDLLYFRVKSLKKIKL